MEGESAQIQCKVKDSEIVFEFVECEMTIIPDLHSKMLNVRIGHFFRFDKDTKYKYSGNGTFMFNNIAANRFYMIRLYNLTINFQNYNKTCELNDNNLNTMFLDMGSKEYVYPCNNLVEKPIPIPYSQYFGTCCCILSDDKEEWTKNGDTNCVYIYYASGCANPDSPLCFKKLTRDLFKYSLCRTCARHF
ncbi:hypothetical protein RF11_13638 [Thelohanellus kitauei]|uniref:Uncharacterized protein n=1 Tax=Thelohanellus kitauei TaxID=669202 RepID=A0A0C2IXY1_THEKT|nr:hypothetical protein RF11_13638 [Thelohanellus kitauei]